jgi:transcriptional antiterminator RfaH
LNSNRARDITGPDSGPAWYCVQAQPKHEHIAAAHLRRCIEGIDVFNPRLRVRRATRRGAVWFVEALFPGYLFARFDPVATMENVETTPGVRTVVRFGPLTPSVPDPVIDDLRTSYGTDELIEVGDDLRPGDEVDVAAGPFRGFDAKVLCVLSAPERIRILLEILGRKTPVELPRGNVVLRDASVMLVRAA